MDYSVDQARAQDRIERGPAARRGRSGRGGARARRRCGRSRRWRWSARPGRARRMLLAELGAAAASPPGSRPVSGDYESRKTPRPAHARGARADQQGGERAARRGACRRRRSTASSTRPLYHPDYEAIAEWLTGKGDRPKVEGLTDAALDRAHGVLSAASVDARRRWRPPGLRGSDFIKGWKRREEPLDIGLIDEASMLDARQFDDLRELFRTLVLFGDPAQLAPGRRQPARWCSTSCRTARRLVLSRIHRQAADNPILDLAHALGDPETRLRRLRGHGASRRRGATRGWWSAERVDADAMARAPVLVWRNATRVRLIHAFRAAHGAPPDALLPGEPLICDGIELPLKHRKRRHGPRGARADQGRAGDLPRPGQPAGLRPAPRRRAPRIRGSASRASSRSRRPGAGGAHASSRRRSMGAVVPARRGGDDPQGAGLAMAGRAGLRARPLCRGAVGAERGRPAALEAPRLRRDHPRRGAAALGDPLRAGAAERAARGRGPRAGAGEPR